MTALDKIASPMPTAEEILGGETQGGVPRPSFLIAVEDQPEPAKLEVDEAASALKRARLMVESARVALNEADNARAAAEQAFHEAVERDLLS